MKRTLALLAGGLLSAIALAHSPRLISVDPISFALELTVDQRAVQLTVSSGDRTNRMSTRLKADELDGIDLSLMRSSTARPIRFALAREPGRLDCSGMAIRAHGSGSCSFSASAAFADLLAASGMTRPDRPQSYKLALVGARRDLLDALRAARYPMPKIDDYVAMTAVGVTPAYIADLARAGYRPREIDDLIEFRAIGVTADYLGALAKAGYAGLPSNRVVEMAALKIDPAFIAGFQRIGYPNLPVDTLVQLKALNVTPSFVESVRARGIRETSLDQIVEMKIFARRPHAPR